MSLTPVAFGAKIHIQNGPLSERLAQNIHQVIEGQGVTTTELPRQLKGHDGPWTILTGNDTKFDLVKPETPETRAQLRTAIQEGINQTFTQAPSTLLQQSLTGRMQLAALITTQGVEETWFSQLTQWLRNWITKPEETR